MASGTVYTAIRDFLEANYTATALVFDNERYDPSAADHWAMIEIAGTYFGRESIGADDPMLDRFEEEGVLIISMMAPADVGTKTARDHLETLAELFRGRRLLSDLLEFEDARVGFGERVGAENGADGNWYRLNMTVDWRLIEA